MSYVVIWIKFALFKEMVVQGACFSFPVNFNNLCNPINITLCILEKNIKLRVL